MKAKLIKAPRWRQGIGRRIAQGAVLAARPGRNDHGRCINLTVLSKGYRWTLQLSDRAATTVARQILAGGEIAEPIAPPIDGDQPRLL